MLTYHRLKGRAAALLALMLPFLLMWAVLAYGNGIPATNPKFVSLSAQIIASLGATITLAVYRVVPVGLAFITINTMAILFLNTTWNWMVLDQKKNNSNDSYVWLIGLVTFAAVISLWGLQTMDFRLFLMMALLKCSLTAIAGSMLALVILLAYYKVRKVSEVFDNLTMGHVNTYAIIIGLSYVIAAGLFVVVNTG